MPDKVFLTDQRRAVLQFDYEGTDSNRRTHKHRIRERSKLALDELIEVAQSGAIDNTEVFDPEQVFLLLRALFHPHPERYTKVGGLKGLDDLEDDYRAYADRLYVQIDKLIRDYRTADTPQTDR